MPLTDVLTIDDAADFLKVTTYQIGHVVITGELRCGVYARGWHGLAIPLLNGKKDVGAWDAAKDGDVYHCSPKGTDVRYTIHACDLAQFWYLANADAYELFTMYRDGIDVRLLEPEDGAALHQEQPDRFPAPEFAVWVEDDSPNRRVTLDDVRFLRRDLKALRPMPKTTENKNLATIAALLSAWPGGPNRWPSGRDLEKAATAVDVSISDDTIRKVLAEAIDIATDLPDPPK